MVLQLAKGVTIPEDIKPAEWLLHSLPKKKRSTGTPVESVIPNVFDEYARVFHPAEDDKGLGTVWWSEVAAWSGRSVHTEMQWEAIRQPVSSTLASKPWRNEPLIGRCPSEVLIPLTELLSVHTTTHSDVGFVFGKVLQVSMKLYTVSMKLYHVFNYQIEPIIY